MSAQQSAPARDPNRPEPTTHDRLAALGLTHRTPEARVYYSGAREILNAAGEVVFTGNVREVNDWLEDLETARPPAPEVA